MKGPAGRARRPLNCSFWFGGGSKSSFTGYRAVLLGENQRHIHQVFADEPDLHLVGPDDVADQQVVAAFIAQVGSLLGQIAGVLEDDGVGFEEARDLHRNLFPALGRTSEAGKFGGVVGHGDAYTAEDLDALGNQVDQLNLFAKVLIEKEMQLVEGGSAHLPMRFLVEVTKAGGIGEENIETFADFLTGLFIDSNREILDDGPEFLNFLGVLTPVGGDVVCSFGCNFLQSGIAHLHSPYTPLDALPTGPGIKKRLPVHVSREVHEESRRHL